VLLTSVKTEKRNDKPLAVSETKNFFPLLAVPRIGRGVMSLKMN